MGELQVSEIFTRRIKELMQASRYTQKQLCELCGITEAAFSRYMTSERLPRTETLANIANVLHTTTDYLIGNESSYDYSQIKNILALSKDDLSFNQKKELVEVLMNEYKRTDI